MKGNPLLRSTLLFLFCFAVFISTPDRANAQTNTTEGSLLALNAKGEPSGACPLKHTDVKADISGFIARVTVTQQFENPFPDKIEAVYTFPLPPAAAVDDMTIVIGDRTIKGKIMRREEAQATYDAARARGQMAALLNQQRPNIFTQAVANILPSQQINVTISYVETLKYDEGSYEWSFPMVIGERYHPSPQISDESAPSVTSSLPESTGSKTGVPDAAEITPPVMAKGMRAGHDISIGVNIDAGVPLVAVHSATHEVEALQPGATRATVRLKDQATIPNKDFVLKYDVAGAQIEDALLFHRQGNDGFFTFILQPPQRVTVADVSPKELVFVLDTSGSMGGFPIEKAKQTMMLALEGLYPGDTFNVITFAGETRILFDAPVPATPENITQAKRLLAGVKSEGGTEMMQAIRAALDPSNAQDHMRITCFLTDGQVGNDMEIIAEVQKHPKARVFAMGFGDAPNRFLLDKITEYGRGEAQYVTENAEAKHAAERFHERVRNPLLTDISIDWAGLPVGDVYPKNIPDLFSAAPVVLSGRYLSGRDGIIRLKGKMAGSEFIREIPVHFPEQETGHGVLATLWARSKVDDLMGQDMNGAQMGAMRDELKTEITNLGLTYRMMTQFTSFVAVDETPGDGIDPRRVDVPVESVGTNNSINASYGGLNMSVTVSSNTAQLMNTMSTITQQSISELPINGRSLQGLYILVPGAVSAATSKPTAHLEPDLFVNGQRSSSNQFIVDGVSGDFGIAPGGETPAASAGGGAPALTATGNTNALAPFNAIQEVQVRTFGSTAEYGRNSGGIVSVVTKSGTNSFHGSAFEIFGARPLNANDWFANSRGLSRPPANTNEFGGTLGGPVRRDQIFFFVAYEGLRLQQPVTAVTDVPSLVSRLTASSDIRQLFNLYPQPNGVTRPDGFGEFASSFANRARHDSLNLRVDSNLTPRLTLGGHYNFTGSRADERGAGDFSLNTLNRVSSQSEMFTGQMFFNASPSVVADLRVNFSRMRSRSAYRIDDFGGAVVPPESVFSQSALFAQAQSFAANLNGHSTTLRSAADATNTQRQFNVVGSVSMVSGTHTLKFGADYRRMFPTIGARLREESFLFDGVSQALTGTAARLSIFDREPSVRPIFNNFSAYAQDEWRVTSRVTLNYGLRWEVDPAPGGADAERAIAVTGIDDPKQLALAPRGTSLWQTTYGNLAPRVGVAYQVDNDATLLIRGSFGVLYDASNSPAGDLFADSYPFVKGGSLLNVPFSFLGPVTPNSANVTMPVSVFDPHLKLPYALQWSASVEKELNRNNVLSIAYVGAANRRALVTNSFFNSTGEFAFMRATDNEGRSDFRGMQIQFRRRAAKGLSAQISYSLGSATDNFSEDTAARVLFRADVARFESGRADFDIRHLFAGAASYELPAPLARGLGNALFRGWRLDSVFNIHSAQPVNVVYAIPTTFGFLYLRPDVIGAAPFYVADATAAGGKRINPAAFAFPLDLRQGTLPRNALQGFPLTQIDLGLRRRFKFTDDVKIVAGIEASNVFNHPNFASPAGNDTVLGTRFDTTSAVHLNPTFGYSFTNAARSGWAGTGRTFGATNYAGGPRVVRFSVKFEF